MVVVGSLAADVEQAVDRAGAAEDAAARPGEAAPVQPRVRLGHEAPIRARVPHRLEVADRDMNPEIAVARPGLEQQHAVRRHGGELVGEHAARRAGADHHVVVGASPKGAAASLMLRSLAAGMGRHKREAGPLSRDDGLTERPLITFAGMYW